MTEVSKEPENDRRTRIAAVGLIALLEIGALIYLSTAFSAAPSGPAYTFSFPTSTTSKSTTKTTTTTGPPPNMVEVKSAIIVNDTLSMDIKNIGTHWTSKITMAGLCTPDLAACYSYRALSGNSLTKLFALAPKAEFRENITGVCVVPVTSCGNFKPVTNFSYYFAVTFGFSIGKPQTLPVVAVTNNTYPLTAAIQGLQYQLGVTLLNGSGRLALNLLINDSIYGGNFTMTMSTRASVKSAFGLKLLSNRTGCGGNMDVDCSSGTLLMLTRFLTVNTGIGTPYFPPPYLLAVRDLTVKHKVLNFAVWVPAINATVNE